VEDDHVDRTGVEAQQCVKLTVTNSSIGFIVLIVHVHEHYCFVLTPHIAFKKKRWAADGAPDDRRRPLAYEGNLLKGSEKQQNTAHSNQIKIQLLDRRLNPSA
jgi:hypothetical protein